MKLSGSNLAQNALWIVALAILAYGLRPQRSGPEPGTKFEPVVLQTLDGRSHRLAVRGKPLLIEAFASWCVACRRNSSTLDAIFALGEQHKLDVVAVSVDADPADAASAAENWPIRAPVFVDRSGRFSKDFAIRVLPTYILVDADGTVRDVHAGTVGAGAFRSWLRAGSEEPTPVAAVP